MSRRRQCDTKEPGNGRSDLQIADRTEIDTASDMCAGQDQERFHVGISVEISMAATRRRKVALQGWLGVAGKPISGRSREEEIRGLVSRSRSGNAELLRLLIGISSRIPGTVAK